MKFFQTTIVGLIFGWAAAAAAQEPATDAPTPAEHDSAEDRLRTVEARLVETEQLLLQRQPRLRLSGYIDVGFFAVSGRGTGFIQDSGPKGSRAFPEFADQYAWVFLGDIMSPAINTRGEPADLGNAPGIDRFDSIASRGAPGFIANEINLTANAAVADNALATASLNFTPRSGRDFRLNDSFDVDLAQMEWMPGPQRTTSIYVGKFEPVMGIEYRERKSDRRFGITPSLIARYTTGSPLGLKIRSRLGQGEWLVLAAAVTNGSSGTEAFHFHDEIDSNTGKTGSARIAVRPFAGQLEMGVSGEYGPQDHALDSQAALWFAGVDARASFGRLELKAQWLMGRGQGETDRLYEERHRPWGLRLESGAYVTAELRANATFGAYARGELRDAQVWLGSINASGGGERLYLTRSWRATLGARAAFTETLILKIEYLYNGEYGGIPAIANNVFTSSLVLIL